MAKKEATKEALLEEKYCKTGVFICRVYHVDGWKFSSQ